MTVRALLVAPTAERTGVPVGVLRLAQGLAADGTVEPRVLLLRGGTLVDAFAAVAPTEVLDPRGRGVLDLVPTVATELGQARVGHALGQSRHAAQQPRLPQQGSSSRSGVAHRLQEGNLIHVRPRR